MQNKVTVPATPEIAALIKEFRAADKKKDEASDASSKLQKALVAHVPYTHEGKAVDSWTFTSDDASVIVSFVATSVLDKNVEVLKSAGLTQGSDYVTTTKATFDTQDMNAAARENFLTALKVLCSNHGVTPEIDFSHKLADRDQLKKVLGAKYNGFMTALKPTARVAIK